VFKASPTTENNTVGNGHFINEVAIKNQGVVTEDFRLQVSYGIQFLIVPKHKIHAWLCVAIQQNSWPFWSVVSKEKRGVLERKFCSDGFKFKLISG
jgi:hypothetical protein